MGRSETDDIDKPSTEFVYCDGAITEVLKYGSCNLHNVLILVIPGNPGVVGFYATFMQTLHRAFGRRFPVWAVSHAGHCEPPDQMDLVEDTSLAEESDVFGINGQIQHKLTFLRRHVPRETRLVLIGHSIGCYIILDMMKRDPELKVLKAVMLFPTIERMARTPQGRAVTPVLCHLRYVAYLPVFLLSLLPESLKRALVGLALGGIRSLDRAVIRPTVGLLSGDCAAYALYMGGQEMKQVLERDNATIKKHLDKLIFYYGATDHWCPVEYFHDMKQDFPDGDFRLCESGFRHAFVLDAGADVAAMVVEWISRDLRT
ncbi:lipid droplet-associated hydrolase [Eucyclogobius newberryi]|uniref:lipid droplet-associated hydrolase n=1 Tax=Eucyclogobius newberryi TaxID=166745 RepID=UPI003B5AD611